MTEWSSKCRFLEQCSQSKIRFYLIFVVSTGTKSSEKNGKKVFLTVYPGVKSEFLRPKTLFMN